MKKDAVLNVRVPGEVKEGIRKAAADDDRSVASMVVRALTEWLTDRGYLRAAKRVVRARKE